MSACSSSALSCISRHMACRRGNQLHVDWEMRVDGSHLVPESAGDADGHVVDVAADGSEGGFLSHGCPPFGDSARLSAGLLELDLQVAKVSAKSTSWSGDGDLLAFNDELDLIAEAF